NFIRYRKIYFVFSGILVIGSIFCLINFGLNPGIDFTGGSILEIEYTNERPLNQEIKEELNDIDLGEIYIQPTGEKGVLLRMKDISEETHQAIIKKLNKNNSSNKVEERKFESIGPTIGKEMKSKTKVVAILSLLAVLFYIALAFRRVSRPVASWQYGMAALIALFHDIFIPLGVFSILGAYQGVQITIPVIAAFLTVLGYSINDSVVVFDRVRENIIKRKGVTFEETANISLNQTLIRSVNTSFTTLLVLFAIFFFGGETLKYFALALIIGIGCGTYSSIFLATPVLVSWSNLKKRHK
ncbi:MAG: protein translocase subunit SecF, partial [Patescibacteria group bacterium]|nr:protein translocase subunit SecF [Patescibacteria group bacterium]